MANSVKANKKDVPGYPSLLSSKYMTELAEDRTQTLVKQRNKKEYPVAGKKAQHW